MAKKEAEEAKTFEELARDLECDEDEDAFRENLRKIAKAPRPPEPKPPD